MSEPGPGRRRHLAPKMRGIILKNGARIQTSHKKTQKLVVSFPISNLRSTRNTIPQTMETPFTIIATIIETLQRQFLFFAFLKKVR